MVWASMLLAGALCALTAFSYMELTSMFPRAGSEQEYARQVFPGWVSFATGWSMTMALIIASGAVALGFSNYLNVFIDINTKVAALLLLGLVYVLALSGMQHARWVIIALSTVQIVGLLIVVVVGAPRIGDVNLFEGNGLGGLFGGAAVIFFAYIGFDEVITLAEETQNPRKTVPRALLLALVISTVLYVMVAIVAVSVLGPSLLAVSQQPLTDVMRETWGNTAVQVVAAIALATTANTTLLATTAASRMMYSMSETGLLPKRLGAVHNMHSPRLAIGVAVLISAIVSLTGGIEVLAEATNALIYVMFLMVNTVVIILRRQRPNVHRPFRIWGSIGWVPVVPITGFVATLALSSQLERAPLLVAFGFIAAGIAVYFTGRGVQRSRSGTIGV
jgi:basic amino acid/polyamine antiporter, APA family